MESHIFTDPGIGGTVTILLADGAESIRLILEAVTRAG